MEGDAEAGDDVVAEAVATAAPDFCLIGDSKTASPSLEDSSSTMMESGVDASANDEIVGTVEVMPEVDAAAESIRSSEESIASSGSSSRT